MIQSRYWQWHIKCGKTWTETRDHERADGIKPVHPEAMPVLGSLIWHCVPTPADTVQLYESLAPDVPF